MVDAEKLYYRSRIEVALDPVMELLRSNKNEISLLEWLRLVEKVKESIKQKPQQQLGDDLPSPDELNVIIDEIFQNFLRIEILLS